MKDLLPSLPQRGYGTLCFEVPQNLTSSEIVTRHAVGLQTDLNIEQQAKKCLQQVKIVKELREMRFSELDELMRLYVSRQRHSEVAEKLRQLSASSILKEVFSMADKYSISIRGIDIDAEAFDAMVESGPNRMARINRQEDRRIRTMFDNLLNIRKEQEEGIVFVCGALHMHRLLAMFDQHGMQKEVLYYLVHSPIRYPEESFDALGIGCDPLHRHVLAKEDVRSFGFKVIEEMRKTTQYTRELQENSHSQCLSDLFQVPFRALVRPGVCVNALLAFDKAHDIQGIKKRIEASGIKTHELLFEGVQHLVVPNVNTIEIGQKLRKISPQ